MLTYVDLSSNFLSCEIPLKLENLSLNHLNISYNNLYGNILPFYAKSTNSMNFLENFDLCRDSCKIKWHVRILLPIASTIVFISTVTSLS